jgi:ANTAR domain-containing protein
MDSDHANPTRAGPSDTGDPATMAQLETTPVIERAKGIVMAKTRRPEAEAFDLLRQVSQRRNVAIQNLAAWIIASTVRNPPATTGPGQVRQPPRRLHLPRAHARRPPVSRILLLIGEL